VAEVADLLMEVILPQIFQGVMEGVVLVDQLTPLQEPSIPVEVEGVKASTNLLLLSKEQAVQE
jgi:hypothetical protein|tara:strand:- start:118 stop:306 length:189 start_codon:yes stop_codon:yes gene_type:complete